MQIQHQPQRYEETSCSSTKSVAQLLWKSFLILQINLRSGLSKLGALSRIVHCFGTGLMFLNIWLSTISPTQETIKITLDNMHPVKKITHQSNVFYPLFCFIWGFFCKYVIFTDHTCDNCLNKCLWEYMTISTTVPGAIQVSICICEHIVSAVDRRVRNRNSALW